MHDDLQAELAALRANLAELRPGPKEQLSMIVFSGELDKLLAAFVIANGAAASGMRSILFFTFWGTTALRDPRKRPGGKDLVSRLFGGLLPRGTGGIGLSRLHLGGLGAAMIRDRMRRKKVPSLEQMIEMAGRLGVEVRICEMSMDLMGFRREEMIDYPHLEYCGVATFLADARESSIQLFL